MSLACFQKMRSHWRRTLKCVLKQVQMMAWIPQLGCGVQSQDDGDKTKDLGTTEDGKFLNY